MRNVFAQEGRGFPAFWGSQHVPGYQQFWMVYPEISAGYVGVSDSSLEFVHADESRLTPLPIPPLPLSADAHVKKIHQCTNTHSTHGGVRVCFTSLTVWCLQGLLLSLSLGSDNTPSVSLCTVRYSNYYKML